MDLRKLIIAAFVLSGMAALIYELVWIRPIQFVLGSTIYTASIIFAAFMAGLALGSFIISKYVDKIKNLPQTYALLELGIGLYGVLLLLIFNQLPDLYRVIYTLHQTNFYIFEFIQFFLIFLVLLIPTTLMGATFPVIAKFYTKEKIGKGVGTIYSANNIGAIIGSFLAGFILIPLLGIKLSIIFAALINILIASSIILVVSKILFKKIIPISIILFIILSYFVSYDINKIHTGGSSVEFPEEIIKNLETLYYKEGLHSTITVKELVPEGRTLFINGKGQGSTRITDLRINFLLSYLPLLLKQDINKALVIGLGTGTTSGQLAQFTNTTTVEIEPAVAEASKYFDFMNLNVLENPNHDLVISDGRNYLLQNKEKYDIIASELNDPWYSFSNPLFSKEFFELAREDLTEKGLFIHWLPIYEFSVEDFRSSYKTFNSVFPYTIAFANVKEDEQLPVPLRISTIEIILIGSKQKIDINKEEIKKNFDSLPLKSKQYLNSIGLDSSDDILHLLLFTDEQMKNYGEGAELITDDNPILEFSTVKNVFYQKSQEIISDLVKNIEENKK